ncbi:MAG TPA: hypothetical protein VKJ65_09420 [Phycisphaerae bacterium]|nr:hypothetical protein [Phycisphaerae bacterium]
MPEKWTKILGWTSCGVGFAVWLTFAIFALPMMNGALIYALGLQPLPVGTVLQIPIYRHQQFTNQDQTVAVLKLQFNNPNKKAKPAPIDQFVEVTGNTAKALDIQGLFKPGAAIVCFSKGSDFEPVSEEIGDLIIMSFLGGVVCCIVFTSLTYFQIWIGFKVPDPNAKWVRKYALARNKFIYGGYPIRSILMFLGYFVILGLLTWYINTLSPARFTSAVGLRIPDLMLLILLIYTALNFGFLGLKKP